MGAPAVLKVIKVINNSSNMTLAQCFFDGLFVKVIINGVAPQPPIEHTIN